MTFSLFRSELSFQFCYLAPPVTDPHTRRMRKIPPEDGTTAIK